jgi:serine/threonine protein kinase
MQLIRLALSKIPEINTYDAPFSSPLTQELPPKEVSIQTVELVAAAKIYLETRYNELFSRMSKSIENTSETLERRRHGCDMANNTHTMAHEKFRNPDSDYLRLFRALKTHRKTKVTKFNQVSDYEVIRLLGKGSFGAVQLVRNKGDISSINNMLPIDAITNDACRHYPQNAGVVHSSVYAMKVIRKSDMLRKGQEGHLRAERDFLVASEHSHWVVPLIECFQDNNHLYLVMEYMIGGDFLGLLQRYKILSEEMARFYLAEMILCIEEVHRMNWIHRDIKPDNFLISSSGHLKISDFGLAFDGHWCHNQKYFIESRYSVLEKLGVEIMGDARDIEEAKLCEKLEFDCSDETKPKSASPKGKTTRPEGHLLLDSLNISWKRKLAKSVVGTSQYMAPEVIKGEEYDGRCD